MEQAKSYKISADLIRIFAGFGVVLIHVTDPFVVYPLYIGTMKFSWIILYFFNTFFRTSVPLFVVLSGYLILKPEKEINIRSFYTRRFTRVGIPFVFWLIIYFLYLNSFESQQTSVTIVNKILASNLDFLYYLVVILELYILTPVIIIFLQNINKSAHKWVVLGSFIFTLLLTTINYYFPAARVSTNNSIMTIFIPYICYYLAGYYFRDVKISSLKAYAGGFVLVFLTLFTVYNSNGNPISFALQSAGPVRIIMTLISFILFLHIGEKLKTLPDTIWGKIIKTIAACIFGIYLVHWMLLGIFDKYTTIEPGSVMDPLWFFALLKTIIIFALSFTVVSIGRKLPFVKALFG